MCDFSLQHKLSRKARVGEKLVTTQFTDALTRGLSSAAHPDIPVCVRPGTEMVFSGPARAKTGNPFEALASGIRRVVGIALACDQMATFIQVDKDNPHKHHDALQFSDGSIVLLHHMVPGQEVTVLTVPAEPETLQGRAQGRAGIGRERAAYI